jgi:hypothetical protein
LSWAAAAWRASFARDSDCLDRVAAGLRDWVRDRLALLDCDRDWLPPRELLVCFDPDERVALGRGVVLARDPVGAFAARPLVDRDADLLADPLREAAEELLLAPPLGRELDLDDCERGRA